MQARIIKLFLAMYKRHGWLYTQGYFLGWLSYLASFDITIRNRLRLLEQEYGIEHED